MANVLFKRGLQADLPVSNAIEGSFYLTTDTHRLYYGNADGGVDLLSQAIAEVATQTALNALTSLQQEGQFVYISDENILAVYHSGAWVQVNHDTSLAANNANASIVDGIGVWSGNDLSNTATGGDALANAATVGLNVADTEGAHSKGKFSIAGGSNVTVDGNASTGTITIAAQDTTYTLGSSAANAADSDAADGAKDITLNLDASGSGTDSSITLKSSSTVTLTRDATDGSITLAVNEMGVSGIENVSIGTGDGATSNPSTNGFNIDIELSSGGHVGDDIDPLIVYGSSADQTVHFVNGTATLSVPTIGEVRALVEDNFRDLNAMTYKGTASQASDIPGIGAGGLHNGDVYLADNEFTIDNQDVYPGYMIIVQGQENSSGVIPSGSETYTVVSGNDTDTVTTATAITHGLKIGNNISSSVTVGSIALTAGTAISLTDTVSGTNQNSIEVAHANVTSSSTTGTAISASAGTDASFSAITGVTVNSQGHVTAVETTSISIEANTLDDVTQTVAVANNIATITTQVTDLSGAQPDAEFKIGSSGSSITVTATTDANGVGQINLDLVWGSF